ncbi:S8 family serine peptidase [Dictyobacter aurantiacus]|uniref:Peptidase S8/S53 domain-containing protein n=1 Tax=Dictyobacter aurantiacus TaxID=1936993 RepID=A0A401ZLX3_9CHLR|nr:S8 family serine peptidase [Dictyobacter aurantiacus]GCE07855.1 hypothetical protein KDAU_51840 [Dictyobacter aurantiacus]
MNGQPALGDAWQPVKLDGVASKAGSVVPGRVLLQLASGTTIFANDKSSHKTSSPTLNKALEALHTTALRSLGNNLVLAEIGKADPTAAATQLATISGVVLAEPDRYVMGMNTPPTTLPTSIVNVAAKQATTQMEQQATSSALPSNYGLTSSLESWLNAGGVNAMGAYQELQSRYNQLPGTGEIITNVCIGDLTDQSMADAGDSYVRSNGPTTIVRNGQRYLDLPSMPLIPTWTTDASGKLDPTGSTEGQDPANGEILLDFSVMAPLPHDQQRPDAIGSGATDLLGIAPGASYRLVVPSQPTFDEIATALLAAAQQNPRPTVINASLGFGTDVNGFAGRYLEDDLLLQSTISTIVHQYGITVTIAANDGTRLYTPASVGPDGGSTPTNVTSDPNRVTNIDDDAFSTTPSQVMDSGAIAAGGTTTDNTLTNGNMSTATVAETRVSGSGNFSSGFGSRINLSAPSDNIVAFEHYQTGGATAQSVLPVLTGGTSAAAPEIAAAAAVVHQAGLLTGHHLMPAQIRTLLESTGRTVGTPAQIDRQLQVGPQLDITAAVDALLPHDPGSQDPQLVRLSVAHHQTLGGLGGRFIEMTDQNTIDLAGPSNGLNQPSGEGLSGPVTFAADLTNTRHGDSYQLTVGSTRFLSATPSIRVTPIQLLEAAGLPVVSTTDRTLNVAFDVLREGRTVASVTRTLTLSASDGTFTEALAPTVNPIVQPGHDVSVQYDLSGVRNVASPQLVVSTVGHWNPVLAPLFNVAWSTPLTQTSGTITIPASVFSSGGGIYGVGLIQNSARTAAPIYGEFAPVRLDGFSANNRPDAPIVSSPGQKPGHQVIITRNAPDFTLRYSVDEIDDAQGAILEISAPGPTLYNSLNTFTAQNGTARDNDGYDSGSIVYQRLPGTSGVISLNAPGLDLTDALQYNLRILPVNSQGDVVGQASPSSALTFNNGIIPDDGIALDFAIAGPDSIVISSGISGLSVLHYNSITGVYGATITRDVTPNARYSVIGVDTQLHRVLLTHQTSSDTKLLEIWDMVANQEVGEPITLASNQYVLQSGRVDQQNHRAALLMWVQPGNADEILPLDLATGKLGTAIPLDSAENVSAGYYNTIDLDQATGHVHVSRQVCLGIGSSQVLDVNLDTMQVTASTAFVSNCSLAFADDQQGGNGWSLSYTSFSVNFPGTTRLQSFDEKTLLAGNSFVLRREKPLTLAVDGIHHLAVVAYKTPVGKLFFGMPPQMTDSNVMSQLDLLDLNTGAVVRTLSAFNFINGLNPLGLHSQRGIQLDPSTRTGWTFGPDNAQIQAFKY